MVYPDFEWGKSPGIVKFVKSSSADVFLHIESPSLEQLHEVKQWIDDHPILDEGYRNTYALEADYASKIYYEDTGKALYSTRVAVNFRMALIIRSEFFPMFKLQFM